MVVFKLVAGVSACRRWAGGDRSRFAAPGTQAAPHAAGLAGHGGTAAAPAKEVDANHILVKSPIVGTYYDQASPGTPPFIRVGDAVEHGQVLKDRLKMLNEAQKRVKGVKLSEAYGTKEKTPLQVTVEPGKQTADFVLKD